MLRLNPYRIGFRTIKTAIGMALGVIIAKLIGLDNFASSAILVVLCIKDTKVHSLNAIVSRFISCLIAILLGFLIFQLLGQSAIVLGLIVLIFIPLTVSLKVQEGVVTSIVILLHIFNAKTLDFNLIINEVLLLFVGLGIAFLMNLIMPSLDRKLKDYKNRIESSFTEILMQFGEHCKHPNTSPNFSFNTVETNIKKAKSYAFRDVKNHYVRNENSYYNYFNMREEQLDVLKRIQALIGEISTDDPIHQDIAQLFQEIALNVNSNNYTLLRLHSLYEIKLNLEKHDLPKTHAELKSRASIIQILNEMEVYLKLKSEFGSLKHHNQVIV
ncbi:aromatic acid exporter family protein [Staphylococcus massiliensis]|uniref:Putative aromatic acid exporter C-terminal domain-containing protein n=1 Tax=Staphylococcus massiliensis S46 TaxID=1229783 RepID=K9B4W0_9STAP|nr:aromatic acid exporter family protein [Staphylococcus massiliensis]EKU49842.1 hypothetical protein C273_03070 [Staphylococcus massiliensis S46]MCG3398946.1 aromatic acid exporter family protein [Staphylococcus massiliensis]MCG3412995.1 aromatic acid exporter family protein [Staphylococcus massiliensis]POA02066.1 aromatic acid exporter family protein [Staphylococcus massiliensis CCUG 55927]